MLGFAPILYVCMGAWLYSNEQTFFNHVSPAMGGSMFMDSHHYFEYFWQQLTPGTVFFLYLLVIFFLTLVRLIVWRCKIVSCYSNARKAYDIPVQ